MANVRAARRKGRDTFLSGERRSGIKGRSGAKVCTSTARKTAGHPLRRATAQPSARLASASHDKKSDQWLQSFAILTTTPTALTRAVHTRMPVILQERDYDEWLLRDEGPPPVHRLQPFPAAEMQARPVSRDVGNVKSNHPDVLNCK